MGVFSRGVIGLIAALMLGQVAQAGDVALILANERYDNAPRVPGAAIALDARAALESAGFRVITGEALNAADARARVAGFLSSIDGAGRVVVFLAGQTVHAARGGDAWWLSKESSVPNAVDAGVAGLSIGGLMDLAAGASHAALVLVGTTDRPIAVGPGLLAGPGTPQVPPGVTLITGPVARLQALLANDMLRPGRPLRRALAGVGPDVSIIGYIPDTVLAPAPVQPAGPSAGGVEQGFWNAVALFDSTAAYRSYLDRYPFGAHAAAARKQIAVIRDQPLRAARLSETALGLKRDQRRVIQRNLSILGFNPHGIDGIFGPGTRSAITDWQKTQGQAPTGYLSAGQLSKLQVSADRRSAELEAEAARRQQTQDRRDTAYWRDTGAGSGESGLRAYLKRYPDGIYAAVAQARLNQIDAGKRDQAAATDRQAWDRARTRDTKQAYDDYLSVYPHGSFAADARARLDQLAQDRSQAAAIRAAQAAEAKVAGNPITRLLAEKRLQKLGFGPGAADGRFDDKTRSAIRRYQETRGLTVTGYLDEATVVRLLAGQ